MIKTIQNGDVYIIQLRPETSVEKSLLRDIQKAERGVSEYDYWDVKPKEKKDFMDEKFTLCDSDEENPFLQKLDDKANSPAEEPSPAVEKKEEYTQQEFEWEK